MSTTDAGFVPWPAELAAAYRAQGIWRGQSLFAALAESAARAGERTALVDARRRLSHAQLITRSEALARGFTALGIAPGDAVLVQLPNWVAFVEACLALFRIGARPVMAQPPHRRFELCQFAHKTRAVAHLVPDTFARCDYRVLARELRAECPALRHTIVVGDAHEHVAFDSLLELGTNAALPPLPGADQIALFQLSGGSTDVPKLIARTHDDYLYSVRVSNQVCGFDPDTVFMAVLPAAHNFTLSSPGSLGALLAGGRVVMCEQPTPDLAFDMIEREQVNVTGLVPSLLPAWLAAAARRRESLRSLLRVLVGGAKLHEQLARRIQPELGAELQQVFGMAEGLVCYTRKEDGLERALTTQGKPMSPHDEVRVVDAADRDVAEGEVGNLLTRGPYTIRGYYAAAAHNLEAFTEDGFYRTGDCVRRLADDSLIVEGRAKDQINRGGEKIAAPEIEALLITHPGVEAAALVPVSDPHLGERSCAFVVANEPLSAAQLRAHLQRSGLAAYKIPDRFQFVASLPKTAIGKVDKQSLRSLAEAERTPVAPLTEKTA